MSFNLTRHISRRYLKSQRKESFVSLTAWFSLVGITLGVATLIIVLSVMNGFRTDLMERILGFNGHITVFPGRSTGIENYESLTQKLRSQPGITQVTPLMQGDVMVTSDRGSQGARVVGIRFEDLENRGLISEQIRFGSLEKFAQQEDTIVIGRRMAEKNGLLPGDQVTLISPQGNNTVFGTLPRMRNFTVIAIYQSGMSQYDESYAFIPLTAGQKFFRKSDENIEQNISEIEIFTDNPEVVERYRQGLSQELLPRPDYNLVDWKQVNATFFEAIAVERNMMFIIVSLIIMIAAFNIITTLVIMIKNKTKDIAILKTIGATDKMIYQIFLKSGWIISGTGIVTGTILGLLFCLNIEHIRQGLQYLLGIKLFSEEVYFLAELPARVDPMDVVLVVTFTFVISTIFSIFPAKRASKLNPVEGLRHD